MQHRELSKLLEGLWSKIALETQVNLNSSRRLIRLAHQKLQFKFIIRLNFS